MTTLLSVLVLAAACADDAPDDLGEGPPPLPGIDPPATGAPASLPPEDASVPAIEATLSEWNIVLSRDSVAAGAVAFQVRNTGTVTHRFEVEGAGEEWVTDDIPPNGDVTMSLSLAPGEYVIYCPIGGGGQSHRERGMRTTLRVY